MFLLGACISTVNRYKLPQIAKKILNVLHNTRIAYIG